MDHSSTFTRKFVCILLATILFAVGAFLTFLDEGSSRTFQGLLFSGLALFAGAFL